MKISFVPASSPDFRMLAAKLDAYYFELVGDIQNRYAEVNRPENMTALAVVYEAGEPIACGAWKRIDGITAELKRLYVLPEYRRRGAASRSASQCASSTLCGYRNVSCKSITAPISKPWQSSMATQRKQLEELLEKVWRNRICEKILTIFRLFLKKCQILLDKHLEN